jgi:hypothetical protein
MRPRVLLTNVWVSSATFMRLTERADGLKLGVIVQQSGQKWFVLAVETPGEDVETILATHAHKAIGTFGGPLEAFVEGEHYAERWRDRAVSAPPLEPCACPEIGEVRP